MTARTVCPGLLVLLSFTLPPARIATSESAKEKEVAYDLFTCRVELATGWESIEYKQGVHVKVTNFNPLLYEVTVNGEVINFNQTVPSIITAGLAGQAPEKKEDKEQGENIALLKARLQNFKTATPKEKAEARKGLLKVLRAAGDMDVLPGLEDRIGTAGIPTDEELVEDTGTFISLMGDYDDAVATFRGKLADAYSLIPRFEKGIADTVSTSDDLGKKDLILKLGAVAMTLGNGAETLDATAATAQLILDGVSQSWTGVADAYSSLTDELKVQFMTRYREEEARWKLFRDTDEKKLREGVDRAINTWRTLEQSKFEANAGPFMAEGDELCIKITVRRKDGKTTYKTATDKKLACFWIRGGVKVDFSLGVFASKLTDRAYGKRKNEQGKDVIARLKDEEDTAAMAAGALIHVYERAWPTPWLQLAGSFGFAAVKMGEMEYLLGGSALFGRQQRGVLTFGVAGGKVTQLGGGYREGDPYPPDVTSLPTKSVFDTKLFLAFTFNLPAKDSGK